MLKNFFIAFMGTMAAIWLSGFLFIVGIILVIAIAIGGLAGSMEIEEHSILVLDLHGAIPEREVKPSVSEIVTGDYDSKVASLDEMIKAIRLAASDSNIDGLYINCAGSEMGYASRHELIDAINEFKKSGKWVYAYGDTYSQGDYYVASAATRLFVNPKGAVDLHGLSSTVPFFKNALDKLGVDVQVFKVGEFKSAVEPYLLTEMSEPAKLQTQVYLDAIWKEVSKMICVNRNIEKPVLDALADTMLIARQAPILTENHLVDELCYRREVENKMRKLTSIEDDEDLRFVTPTEYLAASNISQDAPSDDEPHVAVVYAVGDIVDDGKGGIVAADLVPVITSLADDENVKGVVLRVNSGGGSAFASEQIWEAFEYVKKCKKPFYVSMGDYAASGGYYISCGADMIYADAETLTGSIGIFGMIPSLQNLLNNHIGVNFTTVNTNTNAAFPQIVAPMSQYQYDAMQQSVEDGYRLFTTRVAEGRNMDVADVLKIAEGRVWDGATALEIGLVDQIGTLDDAVKAMLKKTGVETSQVISYPVIEKSPFEQLFLGQIENKADMLKSLAPTFDLKIDGLTPDEVNRCYEAIRRITSCSVVQARMEDITLH